MKGFAMRSVRVLLPLLLSCLAVVAPGRAAFAQQAAAVPAKPNLARFEKEIAAYEAADLKTPPPTGGVLFIGSSSIRLWTTVAKDFPELTVLNRGFGGSVIRESTHFAPRIVLPYKPKTIVMYAGGNDLHMGMTPAQVRRDFEEFVTTVHAALPDTRIAYISINPSVSRWSEEDRVLEANRLIADYVYELSSKGAKLSFLDSHARLLSPEGKPRPEFLRTDGLHLNADGYTAWVYILKPELLEIVNQDKR
jgi:lysophospholipase L1-like esterase